MPFAGGIMQYGYQCGMLWGAALAAGVQAYRLFGPGPQAETAAVTAAQRLVESFRAGTKDEINCLEITEINFQGNDQILPILKFLFKGGPIGCFRMAARYAPEAFAEISTAFPETPTEAPSPPVSCAAVLAHKIGATEMHTVMAAGFAGGIGLSGGGCGALGAAIWLDGMRRSDEPIGFNAKDSWAGDMVECLLESADFEFECAEIVGRKFENIDDHADYLRDGGCTAIIEALASQ